MSIQLIVVMIAAVGLAAIAALIARFMTNSPNNAIRQRIGQVVHEADPDLRARVSLQELQQPASSVHGADDEGVGR